MKRLTLALMTAAASMSMPLSSYAAGTMPPMFDWSGPYAGAQLGYGFGHDQWILPSAFAAPSKTNNAALDGVIVGGTAGYNMMMNSNVVLGIEGDFAFSGISSNSMGGTLVCFPGGCQLDVTWFGTARARLGYAMGDTMPYVTGGLAAAHLDAHAARSFTTRGRGVNVGWTVGAGIEHAFSSNVTGKIEYLYTDLGHLKVLGIAYTNVKFSVVRVGVDFHF